MAFGDIPTAPFVVQGKRRNGTVTYLCPDADRALRKLADFDRAGYTEIKATGPGRRPIGEAELKALCETRKASEPAET